MRVIRSAGQNVSPSDDGRLYDQIFTDGLFEDATVTALGGNNIALSALYGVICGRDFTAEAQTINATLPEADTASGYIYVEIDTSSDDIITIGTALAPFTPTYENINTNGAVAQMVIATYEASAVAVTSVTATYAKASAGGVGSLATIEASPATANHSVGSFLVYNGTLYKVTRAIAAGEALVVGTNISATTAGAELTSLNNDLRWKLVGQATGSNNPVSINSLLSTAKEFLIVVAIDNGGNKESILVPRSEVSGNSWFRAGGYTTTSTPVLVTVLINNSVSLIHASLGTTDYTSTSVVKVYYR